MCWNWFSLWDEQFIAEILKKNLAIVELIILYNLFRLPRPAPSPSSPEGAPSRYLTSFVYTVMKTIEHKRDIKKICRHLP